MGRKEEGGGWLQFFILFNKRVIVTARHAHLERFGKVGGFHQITRSESYGTQPILKNAKDQDFICFTLMRRLQT